MSVLVNGNPGVTSFSLKENGVTFTWIRLRMRRRLARLGWLVRRRRGRRMLGVHLASRELFFSSTEQFGVPKQ